MPNFSKRLKPPPSLQCFRYQIHTYLCELQLQIDSLILQNAVFTWANPLATKFCLVFNGTSMANVGSLQKIGSQPKTLPFLNSYFVWCIFKNTYVAWWISTTVAIICLFWSFRPQLSRTQRTNNLVRPEKTQTQLYKIISPAENK